MTAQDLEFVRQQLFVATADLSGATKGQLMAWLENAQFDTNTFKSKKPRVLDEVTGKMITLDNPPIPGKQSHAKGSHIPLVQPIEYVTASWRRALLSLEEHHKAWLLWNYGENISWDHQALIALLFFCCFGALIWNAGNNSAKYQEAQKEIDGQRAVIAKQAFDFNRFNQVSDYTSQNNSLIGANIEKTVIEYREILRREKTCDLPVPAYISDGLLDYANRLRAGAMHADPSITDSAGNSSATAKQLTYCQVVLWIKPLLAAIEVANNQLTAIREIESQR